MTSDAGDGASGSRRRAHPQGANLGAIGVILKVVGGIGLLATLKEPS